MKKLLLLFVVALLTACGSVAKSSEPVEADTSKTVEVVDSQVDLNDKLKEEAKEYSFVELNGGKVEENTKVKLTGEVSVVMKEGMLGEFVLTTTEGNGFGMFTVTNVLGTEVAEGSAVTVYGMYYGKSDSGMPLINSPVVEVN